VVSAAVAWAVRGALVAGDDDVADQGCLSRLSTKETLGSCRDRGVFQL